MRIIKSIVLVVAALGFYNSAFAAPSSFLGFKYDSLAECKADHGSCYKAGRYWLPM